MTALELTIHPKQPSRPGPGKGWADWRRDQDRECKLAHDKRFSDAELAAEHWASCTLWFAAVRQNDGYDGVPLTREYQRQAGILERFATHPHYYEETE